MTWEGDTDSWNDKRPTSMSKESESSARSETPVSSHEDKGDKGWNPKKKRESHVV